MFETRQMGKVVQHRDNIKNPLSNLTQLRQLSDGAVKTITFSQKSGQRELQIKKKDFFFAFSHFNNFFVILGHIPAIFKFLDLILS